MSPDLRSALIAMPSFMTLYESGGRLNHVYFPSTAIVALL